MTTHQHCMCKLRTLMGATVGMLIRICCGCGHERCVKAWR